MCVNENNSMPASIRIAPQSLSVCGSLFVNWTFNSFFLFFFCFFSPFLLPFYHSEYVESSNKSGRGRERKARSVSVRNRPKHLNMILLNGTSIQYQNHQSKMLTRFFMYSYSISHKHFINIDKKKAKLKRNELVTGMQAGWLAGWLDGRQAGRQAGGQSISDRKISSTQQLFLKQLKAKLEENRKKKK